MTEYGPIIFPGLGGLKLDPNHFFQIGNFSIYYYGVIIACGLMLSVIYGMKRCKQFGLKQDDILDGILWIVPLAIVCTRLYYVFSEWDQFAVRDAANKMIWADTLKKIINLRDGGLAIYGGVIGAAIGVLIFAKVKKVSLPAVLDLVAVSFLIGQAIGRWGNFMNREAFGSYCDNFLAMRIAEHRLSIPSDASAEFLAQVDKLKTMAVAGGYSGFIQVHPTFLYESLWNVCGFVLLHFLSKKRQYDGQIALGYVAWYGLGRALIEGLRMDSLYWGPFRASQLLAAVTCIAAVMTLVLMCLKTHDRSKLFVNRVAAMEAAMAAEENGDEPEYNESQTEETEETEIEAAEEELPSEETPASEEETPASEEETE